MEVHNALLYKRITGSDLQGGVRLNSQALSTSSAKANTWVDIRLV